LEAYDYVRMFVYAAAFIVAAWNLSKRARKPPRNGNVVRDFVIVKLGGSAITKKSQRETLAREALSACAAQLAQVNDAKLIVIHGAGSFGHFQAKEYGLSGGTSHPQWRFGFADTRRAVTHLNRELLSSLVGAGVSAISLSPLAGCQTAGKGHLVEQTTLHQAIDFALSGFVPVLHGDCVLDIKQGCSILSGDVLLVKLCTLLQTRLRAVVFVTDVPGVLTHPPGHPQAILIPTLSVSDGSLEAFPSTSTATHDVTGGLCAKLAAAATVADLGCPVDIVQVGSEAVLAALTQQFGAQVTWRGTRIVKCLA